MAVDDLWMIDERIDGKKTGQKIKGKRYGRGKRWRVRNDGVPAKLFEKKAGKGGADEWDTKVKADLQSGVTPFDPTRGDVSATEYMRKWATERYRNPRSRKGVLSRINNHLVPFFEHHTMAQIQASTAKAWLTWEQGRRLPNGEPYSDSTVTQMIDTFSSIMKSAFEVDEIIQRNPCRGLIRPSRGGVKAVTDVWEQDVVDAILSHIPADKRVAALLSATCGHRQGEAFAVAVEDVKFLRKEITVRHQVQADENGTLVLCPPKSGKVRVVPLPEVTSYALSEAIRVNGTTPIKCQCCRKVFHVIIAHHGGLMPKRDWNRNVWGPAVAAAFAELADAAKTAAAPAGTAAVVEGDRTGQHQLRHVYASTLIDGGATPADVQAFMGHASVTITMDLYTHLFKRAKDRARAIIDGAFSADMYRIRTAVDQ